MIVAAATDGTIGHKGSIPWPFNKDDMRRFRELTKGRALIMGRKTHESIGKVLPGRLNIVMSWDPQYTPMPGAVRVTGVVDALLAAKGHAPNTRPMVIGGAEIYRTFFALAENMYVTRVNLEPNGDAKVDWIPQFFGSPVPGWKLVNVSGNDDIWFYDYKRAWSND